MSTNFDLPFIEKAIDDNLEDLIKVVEIVAEFGEEEDKNPNKYYKLAEELFKVKRDSKLSARALDLAKEADSIDAVDNILRDAKNEHNERVGGLKEFKNRIKTILESSNARRSIFEVSNSDLSVSEFGLSQIDPITKRQIEVPAKNKICGHIYDKNSIFEAIALNSRMRCPVMGCGNTSHVQKNHIVDDPTALERMRATQQTSMDITL